MFKVITVKERERVVVIRDGIAVRALAPGRHMVWGRTLSFIRFAIDAILFRASPEVRDRLPHCWYSEVALNSRQRALLVRHGVPQVFLRPGVHRYWNLDASVELVLLSVDEELPELTDELLAILPRNEYVQATVRQHQRGLEYVQGRFTRMLEPGYHAYWKYPEARVRIEIVAGSQIRHKAGQITRSASA